MAWSVALGADAWASDLTGALGTLREWADRPPTLPAPPTELLALQLELDSPALAAGALGTMLDAHPHMRGFSSEQLDRTREDLESIVRLIAAARHVDDVTVLTDFLDWLTELLTARGVPRTALVAGVQALTPGSEAVHGAAGELARYGVRHLSQASAPEQCLTRPETTRNALHCREVLVAASAPRFYDVAHE